MPRAGFVAVAGRPNAGKSSLLNRLVGEHLAITSPKAQTTRHRVVGLRTDERSQMVILDTPGLLEPRDLLHQAMRGAAIAAVKEADVIVHVIDSTTVDTRDADRVRQSVTSFADAAALTQAPKAPVVTVFNKADLLGPEQLAALQSARPDAIVTSAETAIGVDTLVTAITDLLPEHPYLYPPDELSTLPVRFFCAEFVRETAMEQLGDELPHALACGIEEYREGSQPLYIRAVLYVERDSQKRLVIGAGGQRIKKLGQASRLKIERFVGEPVYLDLWVKVLHNWRKNRAAVTRLGYGDPGHRPPT